MTEEEILNHIVFVGGPPRSGTTFAARSLNFHPQLISSIDDHVYECWGLYQYRNRSGLVREIRERSLLPEEANRILAQHLFKDDCLLGAAPSDKTKDFPTVDLNNFQFSGLVRSALDNELVRHAVPVSKFSDQWRLCLKSPEISFVLPQLAGFFPHARFVLVYRPIFEIADSMYRMGNLVKRFPVYHRRWLEEKNESGEFLPPPGVFGEWNMFWQTVTDFQRCVIYAASYISAMLSGIRTIGPGRYFIYNHNELCKHSSLVFRQLADFLSVEVSGFQKALSELKQNQAAISPQSKKEYEGIENELCLGQLVDNMESIRLSTFPTGMGS